ncbi:MAG: hypothetical protein ACTSRP_10300 [Candidatus Helarchaeota archaeon]
MCSTGEGLKSVLWYYCTTNDYYYICVKQTIGDGSIEFMMDVSFRKSIPSFELIYKIPGIIAIISLIFYIKFKKYNLDPMI